MSDIGTFIYFAVLSNIVNLLKNVLCINIRKNVLNCKNTLTNQLFDDIMLWYRDVAQLVARVVWDHDVAGSNPVIPTTFSETVTLYMFCDVVRTAGYYDVSLSRFCLPQAFTLRVLMLRFFAVLRLYVCILYRKII